MPRGPTGIADLFLPSSDWNLPVEVALGSKYRTAVESLFVPC